MKLTVLMTVYNGGKFLRPALESVLGQTYGDFEFLIVDDASQDDSVATIQSFRDSRIRLHRNTFNLGQTRSLNVGLGLARGEYVARMDADDIVCRDWLTRQLAFVRKNPSLAVASVRAGIIDENNRIRKILNTSCSYQDVLIRSLTNSPISHVGSFMNKDVVLKEGGYDERFRIVADYQLWSRLLHKGYRIESNPRPLVLVRMHSQSISMQQKEGRAFEEITEVIRMNFAALADIKLDERESWLIGRLVYHPEALEEDNFRKGIRLLGQAYQELGTKQHLNQKTTAEVARSRIRRLYVRKIFTLMGRGSTAQVRSLSRSYRVEYGPWNLVTIFLLMSFLGRPVTECIPKLYEWWAKSRAKVQLYG